MSLGTGPGGSTRPLLGARASLPGKRLGHPAPTPPARPRLPGRGSGPPVPPKSNGDSHWPSHRACRAGGGRQGVRQEQDLSPPGPAGDRTENLLTVVTARCRPATRLGSSPARVNKRSRAGWWGGGSRAGSRSQPAGGREGSSGGASPLSVSPSTRRPRGPVFRDLRSQFHRQFVLSGPYWRFPYASVQTWDWGSHCHPRPSPATEGRRRPARPGVWAARLGGGRQRGLPVKEKGDNGIDGSLGAV